jgi:hypothetical protein
MNEHLNDKAKAIAEEQMPSFGLIFNITMKVWFSILLLSIPTAFVTGIIYAIVVTR